MKPAWKGFAAIAIGIGLASQTDAQTLFQNNNLRCETELVLCSSEDTCFSDDAESLACRHINLNETFSGSDFNGDGFADCVALSPEASSSPSPNLSVLINRAASAVACEPGPGDQFDPSLDYNINWDDDEPANVLAGNLNGGNADMGVASQDTDEMLQFFNPGTGFGPDGSDLTPTAVEYDVNGRNQVAVESLSGSRTSALFDCNGDGSLDAVIAVNDQSPEASPVASLRINILRNNGSGLQPLAGIADSVSTNVTWNPAAAFLQQSSLTIGDFDEDADLDVAVVIDVWDNGDVIEQEPPFPLFEYVNLCFNNGSCGFTCADPPTIDIDAVRPVEPNPTSVEAGDFDGDGDTDLVVALPDLDSGADLPQGLQYYFGDGAGNFPTTTFVAYPFAGISNLDLGVLTTGCYNNDNVRDVAVTSSYSELILGNVGVFTSDGDGGLNPPVTLLATARNLEGIDTADFDQAGGDDILVLADENVPDQPDDRVAIAFMNGLETVSAIAGADQSADLNQAVAISGASCNVTPEISEPFSDPASFEILWTVSPAAGASLSGADTLTPTFTAIANGAYTLTLSCRTRCTTVVTDIKTVRVGVPIPTPTPSPTATPVFLTQGGCLASLSPAQASPRAWVWGFGLFSLAAIGVSRRWRALKKL